MIRARVLLVVLIAALLGACSHIPTGGPVTEVSVRAEGRGVQIAPEPPHEGMTPSRVVEGFLQAMADPTSDYAVAREYLSHDVKTAWNPSDGAVIYDGWVQGADSGLVLRGITKGVIDSVGRYRVVHEELVHDFALVEEDGQWRISSPPSEVLVSGFMFARSYATVKSYFVATQGQSVIADVLHLPHAELTPARIIAAQLAGPSEALSGAVRTAIPDGVSLGPAGANVDAAGLVTVDLVGLSRDLSDEARRELGAQLLWSLSSISRVTALRITVGGSTYPLPGQNEQQQLELSSQQGFQPLSRAGTAYLYGIKDSRPGRLSPEGEFVLIGSDTSPVGMTAISLDGALVATTSGNPVQVRIGPMGGDLVSVDTGLATASSAQFAQNRLWLQGLGQDGKRRVLSISSQGVIAEVDVVGMPGRLVDFALDSSGVRLAVILEQDGQRVFGTAVVNQDFEVTGWQEVPLSPQADVVLGEFVALDWTGEVDVAVVATGSSSPSVFIVRLDGSEVADIGPISATPVAITALPRPGGDAVAVRSDRDSVLLYQPNGAWRLADTTMSWISYPG